MELSGYLLNIKKTDIKIKDSISIRSVTDTRRNAFITVAIKDIYNNVLKSATIHETGIDDDWSPFTFSLYDLLKISNEKSEKDLFFYGDTRLIFKLHME